MTHQILNPLLDFLSDEDGAATIDFVVLTAATVAMTVAATSSVRDTMSSVVDTISVSVIAVNTSTTFAAAAGEG
ncbi:MAG: hypothetical protein P8L32_05500 [Paracoccaceae bacterium]|jgi:Flp pilus assembly pilin Flp|nr:hypothetical protein [Paracoccaceae bacterium]